MRRDRGFAMVTVLIASVALAGLAYDTILQNRTAIVEAQAQYDRARLEAAANSATALAIVDLSLSPAQRRLPFNGRPVVMAIDGAQLTISLEDERGKIPLNVLAENEVRRMFQLAGARGRDLDTLTDSFLDWRDDDEERRPFGAENADYAPRGIRARDGDLTTLGELARVNGMTPAMYARLLPSVTLWFGESGGFSGDNATPLAREVMTGGPPEPEDTERAIGIDPDALSLKPTRPAPVTEELRGRRFTVRVVARDPRGGVLHRATVIELTSDPRTPFWIRSRE